MGDDLPLNPQHQVSEDGVMSGGDCLKGGLHKLEDDNGSLRAISKYLLQEREVARPQP